MLFKFADCTFDNARRELRRGRDLLSVEPLVLDVLEFLLRNRERVISKDELIKEVWDGRFISDSTVSSRLTALRQAVGDNGREQNLIRTYSRRGYRFVGTVQVEMEGRSSSSPKDVNGPPTLPGQPSIAVLPFTNMSGDPEQDTEQNSIASKSARKAFSREHRVKQ